MGAQQRIALAGDRAGDELAAGAARAGGVVGQRPGARGLRQPGVGVGRRKIEGQRVDRPVEHLDIAALALCLAEIGGELLAARRQIHVLLDVVPIDVRTGSC